MPLIQKITLFEHLKSDQRHLYFVKSVFTHVDIDPNCITNISFKSHYANIDLKSPCVRDSFLKYLHQLLLQNFPTYLFVPSCPMKPSLSVKYTFIHISPH